MYVVYRYVDMSVLEVVFVENKVFVSVNDGVVVYWVDFLFNGVSSIIDGF